MTTIKDTNLTGPVGTVTYDGDYTESLLIVAQALLNLTELFKSGGGVTIGPMINVGYEHDPQEKTEEMEEEKSGDSPGQET